MENIDRENFNEEALICQICQKFLPSNISAVRYAQARGCAVTEVSVDISGKSWPHKLYMLCNTFTPQIKESFCGLNVRYHNHGSPGVLQLPWCATTS